MRASRVDRRKGGQAKFSLPERETLWIALAALSMRMTEVIRQVRGMAGMIRRSVKQLGKLERAVSYQTSILDELPDLVRDEIAAWPPRKRR